MEILISKHNVEKSVELKYEGYRRKISRLSDDSNELYKNIILEKLW